MAKPKKKAEKIDLGEFLGQDYGLRLPSAPEQRDSNQDGFDRNKSFSDRRETGDNWRGGGDRPSREGGGGNRYDGGGRGGNRYERGDRSGDRNERRFEGGERGERRFEAPPSRADEDNEWRRGGGRPSGDGSRPSVDSRPSATTTSEEWRRGPAKTEATPPTTPAVADLDPNWRKVRPTTEEPPKRSPNPSLSEAASDWRSNKTPLTTPASSDNWKSTKPTPTSSASEVSDWRSNRPTPPPSTESRGNKNSHKTPMSQNVEDWRSKKTPVAVNSNEISENSEVITPYGDGILLHVREEDNMRIVKLKFGAEAYLRSEEVIRAIPTDVVTPYGNGKFEKYRFLDGMCQIQLEHGATAFVRLDELIPTTAKSNNSSKKLQNRGNSSGSTTQHRRFGDSEKDRERENAFREKKSEAFQAFQGKPRVSKGEEGEKSSQKPVETPEAKEARLEKRREEKEKLFAAFSSSNKRDQESRNTENRFERPEGEGGDRPGRFERPSSGRFERPEGGGEGGDRPGRFERPSSGRFERPEGGGEGERSGRFERPPRFEGGEGDRPSRFDRPRSNRLPEEGGRSERRFDRPEGGEGERSGRFDRPEGGSSGRFEGGGGRFERPSFPGFNNRDRNGGGDRRGGEGNRSSDRKPPADDKYVGGFERLSIRPKVVDSQDEFPALTPSAPQASQFKPTMPSSATPSAPVLKTQKSTENEKKPSSSTPAPVKKITLELAGISLKSILKDYMVGEDKAAAVKSLKQISTVDDEEFFSQFVASLSSNAFGGTKAKKLVINLLLELSGKNEILNAKIIAEGLTRTLATTVDQDVPILKEIFGSLIEKNPELATIELKDGRLREDKKSDSGVGEKNVDTLANELIELDSASSLTKMKEMKFAEMPGSGVALIKALLAKATLTDPKCAWIEKNHKILSYTLFGAPEAVQLAALEQVQIAFNALSFPKENGVPLIESNFKALFTREILPDSAFISWKDDLSLNGPGRNTAIIQTTNFLQFLEQEDEEEEMDDEDDD